MNTSSYAAYANTPTSTGQSITDHLHVALQRYIPERCAELNRLLQQSSHKELNHAFQYLVDSMFAMGKNGWALMEVTRSQRPHDFACLFEFLAAKGPLFQVAYKLMAEGRSLYQFPISCLPAKSQKMLEEGKIPLLYAKKIPYCSRSHIMLNPFEYYFFSFAYFIVNPLQSKDAVFRSTLVDSLYPSLLENYLQHFLPTDGSSVPPIPYPQTYPRSGWSPDLSRSFYRREEEEGQPFCDEIWRSQSFLLTLMEFWLSLTTDPFNQLDFNAISMREVFVPSHMQMQLVRLIVKHMHYFANSSLDPNDNPIANYQNENPLEDFKRRVLVQHVQKKLYSFLKLSFERWPLDSHFRLALETWLSYIQPWRYSSSDGRDNDESKRVNPKWRNFVLENLLFYTSLFQKLLPRFLRLDLHNVRNAYLLLRLTKVFSQINLQEMILEGEKRLNEPMGFDLSGRSREASRLGPVDFIQDLDGPAISYSPMFGANVRAQVLSLMMHVSGCKRKVKSLEEDKGKVKRSWWSLFSMEDSEDNSLDDLSKCHLYLETANDHLASLFKLSIPSFGEIETTTQGVVEGVVPSMPRPPRLETYRGNPDLQPIRTYEVAFLVRLFYHISSLLNQRYGDEICRLYSRGDWLGRLSRQLLSPPTVCLSNCEEVCLPPRVSLRLLAHAQFLAYLGAAYLVCHFSGYGLFTFILMAAIFVFFYSVFTAIFFPK